LGVSDYYETFSRLGTEAHPSPFPSPHDNNYLWVEGDEVQGLFIIMRSAEVAEAGARDIKTTGFFICNASQAPSPGDVLRNETGRTLRITGIGKGAPKRAENQIMVFNAVILDEGALYNYDHQHISQQ
jgi:hypothetical protein